jgi:hypothetical protein
MLRNIKMSDCCVQRNLYQSDRMKIICEKSDFAMWLIIRMLAKLGLILS